MAQSLTVQLVKNDGHINIEASTQAFRAAALKAQAELETEQGEIAEAVNALFDEHMGKAIKMPTVASMVSQKLNAQPENHSTLTARILDYVRANSQGAVKDGVAERPDSLFVVSKGVRGGCSRRADIPADTE